MTFTQLVYALQAASSALGAFVCLWGLIEFAPCLWRVLKNDYQDSEFHACPYHAAMGTVCLAGVIFAFARMNTIGFLVFGTIAAGIAYVAGMIALCVAVGVAVWAQNQGHLGGHINPLRPTKQGIRLTHIFRMLLIITLAFLAVGLLQVGVE